ncbi:MAG TPA: DUF1707 domain-containing protein [Actinomycetota bacterium]|jgi:Domain of unknown function (DUF1707)/2TM domain|nr:DUF1707 domain-containing protein [Actinomycetota bacterium]
MDRDPGDQRRAALRAADADRERFVETLGRHHADGRLTTEELAERTERAYAAKWIHDLDALATDLPALPASAPPRPAAPPGQPAPPPLPPRLRPAGPRRAAAKANLLRSIMWYALLSAFLVVIWAISGSDSFWPVWPILGFMLLLGGQAINLWYRPGRFDDDRPRRDP